MGASQSYQNIPLHASNPPIAAVDTRFILPNPVTLLLVEKPFSFSGDDFSIRDANNGTPYFKCSGRAMSLSQKKTFLDAYGKPVFNMKRERFAFLKPSHFLFLGEHSETKLCEIRSSFVVLKAKLTVVFKNLVDGTNVELGLKGNWLARDCMIWADYGCKGEANRKPIATIKMPVLRTNNLIFGKQEYWLTAAPGVDIALLVAICIALDEAAHDRKRE
ncbi:tubby C-terminal-like domain-containing protein [Fimicolochytrium jonesii]|uniref:tubby C-terminal-like domain-containing protein n=1 Tax=Fimicolochytrium jonesii TaxID=1396493 RepID=UPI0022FEA536|nr:tubby C-terminal-like domain-containing protein [Fimicolochytrium jonesii]KAI8825107.1 tubby C-terminal-like domain-containing protein [Fimicolochytrium jonesii]